LWSNSKPEYAVGGPQVVLELSGHHFCSKGNKKGITSRVCIVPGGQWGLCSAAIGWSSTSPWGITAVPAGTSPLIHPQVMSSCSSSFKNKKTPCSTKISCIDTLSHHHSEGQWRLLAHWKKKKKRQARKKLQRAKKEVNVFGFLQLIFYQEGSWKIKAKWIGQEASIS